MRAPIRTFAALLIAAPLVLGCDDATTDAPVGPRTFTVTVSNLSDTSAAPSGLSPALWVLHQAPDPFFVTNMVASDALEPFAEDGVPDALIAAVGDSMLDHGVVGTDAGDTYATAPLHPGETLSFEFTADPDTDPRLSLAMMVGESNDWFVATQGSGVPLFDADGAALPSRDVTSMFTVWDAGTEADEPFGEGPNQAARQAVRGAGAPEDPAGQLTGVVRPAPAPVSMREMMRVEITAL